MEASVKRGAIFRDEWGIPHVRGDTADEVAYLQGYAAGTDRAWQVQVEKWRSEGRLAERLGATELPWDRFARRARLDDTARRCFERLSGRTRRWLGSYAGGVNAAVAQARAPEFDAAGCRPDRWHPWSPLGVFLVQHVLFGTFPNKLWRAHVAATLGPDAVALFAVDGPYGSGSNAWAVAGDPVTGRPALVAGDPHRLLELPGIYQQVRLICPEFDVVGFAFPGVPGLPHFGHAGPVAWAITNAMADYQDLYREELRRTGDRVEARGVDGWEPVAAHLERIAVRDGDPVAVEVMETPRGPVVEVDRDDGTALSLRTPARVDGDIGFDALLPLLRARRVGDVEAALRHWVEPVNSVLVADRTGAVRQLVAGRVPVRDARCRREPVPAWEPRYRWAERYAPMPAADITDLAVHANDRRADVAGLGVDFAPPHRAARIRALLAGGAAAPAVHVDDLASHATLRGLLDRLPTAALGPAAARLRDRLLDWDGRMAAASADAGAFAAWRAALVRRLAAHPVLGPLHAPSGFDELFAPWTDPTSRVGLALDGVVAGLGRLGGDPAPAAAAALDDVAGGADPGTWGERHVLHPIHLGVHPAVEAAATALSARVRLSGDNDAVLATSSVPGVSDACWRGPVARYVWNLGDRADGGWVVPFGASGDPGDPHFADQLPLWVDGRLIPLPPADPRPSTKENPPMVYDEELPGLGRLTLAVLDPARDAELVHGWVTQRRAAFWGMLDHSVDDVREIYEFVAGLPTHHAYLIRLNDRPIGLFQSYEPGADPVGERYRVQAGDVGMHLLLAPGRRPPRGLTTDVGAALARFLFRDPAAQRLVVEPDVRNHLALRRLELSGFTFDQEIDMPDKRAQLAFLSRDRFVERYAVPSPS
jgi:penicillin amidase